MRYIGFLALLIFQGLCAQDDNYNITSIPSSLLENANAVVRNEKLNVRIDEFNQITIHEKIAVTVLNKLGNDLAKYYKQYDKSYNISKIHATVFNAQGKEIKNYKRKDFIDVSASGGSMYSDNRVMYVEYTPVNYPYTFEFEVEYKSKSTAWIPRWFPVKGYYISTQNSSYKVENPKQLAYRTKAYNLEDYNIEENISTNEIHLNVKNLSAIPKEYASPDFSNFAPLFIVALNKFQLVNTPADVVTWEDFGIWQNTKLLAGRDQLPQSTINEVENLVKHTKDTLEMARLIYEYMQQKTRYISVQIGIGGWQPSTAAEVDKLGYGDCKGLTNYTMALLKSQGISSYYTLIYGDRKKRDIDEDIVTLQGNHAILTVPLQGENYFLECTSQQTPFNFLGDFTDDRKALMVTPQGGEIINTKKYTAEDSYQNTTGKIFIQSDGNTSVTVKITTGGVQYNYRYTLDSKSSKEKDLYYRNYWKYLHNMNFQNITHSNDKRSITYIQNLEFTTSNYASKVGNDILFSPNMLNRREGIPVRYADRKLPLQLNMAFQDLDEVEIIIPEEYEINSLPDNVLMETVFGTYEFQITKISSTKLLYKRFLKLNSGIFPKEQYAAYRDFIIDVIKYDNIKILLTIKK